MVVVRLKDVTKKFEKGADSVKALHNVNMEIPSSSFYGILGSSGAGKTTLMRIIGGLEAPTEGEVYFDNRVVARDGRIIVPVEERDIGMVFQNWALYPHMTNFDNIAFPLRVKRMSEKKIRQRVNELCNLLGIVEVLKKRPGQISGGQQQRVAVARALSKGPSLLLLDEPFSNLDANTKDDARSLVRIVQKELGVTAIIVSHDPSDIFSLTDTVAAIAFGEVGQISTPRDLYDHPRNLRVASALGEINLLPAKIEENREAHILDFGNGIKVDLAPTVSFEAAGETVKVGLRPEDIVVYQDVNGLPENAVIPVGAIYIGMMEVEISSYSKGSFIINLKFPGSKETIMGISRSAMNPGDNARVYVYLPKLKIFNSENGENLAIDQAN